MSSETQEIKYQIDQIQQLKDIVEVRKIANELDIPYSGNSGIDTIKDKIIESLSIDDTEITMQEEEQEEIEISKVVTKKKIPIEKLLKMDPNKVEDIGIRRQIIRAKALALKRVRITNVDSKDADLEGTIITVSNKYIGKVSKYIPFGDAMENGYHIPQVLLNVIKNKKFPLRKKIKTNKFGVPEYRTTIIPKYQIEELEPLTSEELKQLALKQSAGNSID